MVYWAKITWNEAMRMDEDLFETLAEVMGVAELLEMLEGMAEDENDVVDSFPMSRMPEGRDLKSLLSCYTKENLYRLAGINGVDMKKSWLKGRMVEVLHDHIWATFPERLLFMSDEDVVLLRKVLTNEVELGDDSEESYAFFNDLFPILLQLGLAFYYDDREKLNLFMANEFVEAIADIDQLRVEHPEQLEFAEKASKIMRAGIHLYGVMDVDRFERLYTTMYPYSEDIEEHVERFSYVLKALPILALCQGFIVSPYWVFASNDFIYEEDARMYQTELREKMSGDYYKPSKSEIEFYSVHSFDRTSVVYKELSALCQKIATESSDGKLLLDRIEYHIRFGDDLSEVLDLFSVLELAEFESFEQTADFMNLFSELSNNSRMWVNGGYTPIEMVEMFGR